LNDAQQELIRSSEAISQCKVEIISAVNEAKRALEELKENLMKTLEQRQRAVKEAVEAAVRETYENCTNRNYQPTSDNASIIWSRATRESAAPISLLSYSVSVDTKSIKEAVKVEIDFKPQDLKELSLPQGFKEFSFRPKSDSFTSAEPKSPISSRKLVYAKPLLPGSMSLNGGDTGRRRREEEQADLWTCTHCHTQNSLGALKCTGKECNRLRQ